MEKKQEFKVQTVKVQTLRRRVVKVFGVPFMGPKSNLGDEVLEACFHEERQEGVSSPGQKRNNPSWTTVQKNVKAP